MKKISRRDFIKNTALIGVSAAAAGFYFPENSISLKNHFDLVIKNGFVIDGTGKREFRADVGIKDGRISAIGKLSGTSADKFIDAKGLKITPGFIDIHSHTDASLLVNPRAESKIRQGVTTEVSGQCGYTMAPLGGKDTELDKLLKSYKDELGIDVTWRTFPEFLNYFAAQKFSSNLAIMAGLGTIRKFVIGRENRPATKDEIEQMRSLINEAFKAGVIGVSTGLEYLPGSFASTEELIEVCKAMPENRRIYATHMRNEDKTILEAIDEAIKIASGSGSSLQISHLKACGKSNWYKTEEMLSKIDKAAQSGLNVHADRYPYIAYATSLDMFFPLWAREGGGTKLIERLGDNSLKGKIKEAVEAKIKELNDEWNGVLIIGTGKAGFKAYQGKTIRQIADEKSMDCYETACRIIAETENSTEMMGFGMDEKTTEQILAHPRVMIGSDYSVHSPKPPLSNEMAHPRAYGTFPRVIARYVRDRKICRLEEMIKKMTSMPAQKMQLKDRGLIEKGKIADIVAFDYNKILDRATFTDPHQYPEGIPYVVVSGKTVIDNGEHTGELSGGLIRG